jgi:hypothetical protein
MAISFLIQDQNKSCVFLQKIFLYIGDSIGGRPTH